MITIIINNNNNNNNNNSNNNNSNNNNNNNNRVICTTLTCLRRIDPSFLPSCVTSSELTFLLPTSPPGPDACFRLPLLSFFFFAHFNIRKPPDTFLPVNFRLLFSSQPGQVGSAQPTTNDVITAVPTLPRVVVGPASTAALSSPPGWLSNVVLCPTAAAAAAHTPHQLPTVPIPPSTGRRAPGCCQSPAEGGS